MSYPIILKGSYMDRMSDPEFFRFCQENAEVMFERNEDGTIVVMTPVGARGSWIGTYVASALMGWALEKGTGIAFGSSAGFFLPDGSMRGPDAAWIEKSRWEAHESNELDGFPHLVPDFVIEIRSQSDRLQPLHEKMASYLGNGVKLGWLIDPIEQKSHIYKADKPVSSIPGLNTILNSPDLLPGFELDLSPIQNI